MTIGSNSAATGRRSVRGPLMIDVPPSATSDAAPSGTADEIQPLGSTAVPGAAFGGKLAARL